MKVEDNTSKINKKKRNRLVKQLQSVDSNDGNGIFSTDDWESVDMKKELHPIGYYINDREEMVRQMFSIIKGDRLKSMLPPVLKNVDLDELKADCLIHLIGMSSKRIRAILEGRDLDISSDESDTEDDEDVKLTSNCVRVNTKDSSLKKIRKRPASSTSKLENQRHEENYSEISGDDTLEINITQLDLCDDLLDSNDEIKLQIKKRKMMNPKYKKRTPETTEKNIGKSQESSNKDVKTKDIEKSLETETSNVSSGEKKGKTLLEILELEMRARAIRALLQHDDSPKVSTSQPDSQNMVSNDDEVIAIPTEVKTIDLTCTDDQEELEITDKLVEIDSIKPPKPTRNELSNQVKDIQLLEVDMTCNEEIIEIKSDVNSLEKSVNTSERNINTSEKNGNTSEKNPNTSISTNDIDEVSNSWAQRWLEKKSKDVKRLVSTSKMCTTIRNKMKKSSRKLITSSLSNDNDTSKSTVNLPVEYKGSIEEYNQLTTNITQQNDSSSIVVENNSENNSEDTVILVENICQEEVKCDETVT